MPTWNPESGIHASPGRVRRWSGATCLAVAIGLAPMATPGLASEAQLDVFGFTLRITNADGTITHVLEGERMQQFDDIGQQRAEKPQLELLTEGHVEWIWTAPAAVHYPAAQRLELIGATEGLRLPSPLHPQTEIETADVTILTESREILTDARATMVRPGLFVTGIGMYADVDADIIELKSDVNTVYAPAESEGTPP